MSLSGMEIRLSSYLTEPGPDVEVRRTWRERLLGGYCPECKMSGPLLPWKPWVTHKHVAGPDVPMRGALVVGGVAYVHPEAFAVLRADMENQR